MNKDKLIGKLNELGLVFSQHANDEIKVDRVSIWMKREKWYDSVTGERGIGVNSFLKHISDKL